MANKYQVVDEILKNQGQGTYNITFTNLNITDNENTESVEVVGAISDEVKKNISFKYDELTLAPGIPNEGIATSATHAADDTHPEAWIEITAYNNFDKVAFTGNYDDLKNKILVPEDTDGESPAYETVNVDGVDVRQLKPLSEAAFTGIGGESGNSFQVLDLRNYSISEPSPEDPESSTSKLRSLGNQTIAIKGFTHPLTTDVDGFGYKFLQTKIPSFIVTNSGNYFVLNVQRALGNADNIRYIKFELALISSSTYTHQIIGSSITDEQIAEIMASISISSRLVCFVFDWNNNIIYCKVDSVGSSAISSELATVASTGSYTDLINTPILNVRASNSAVTGLSDVAISGDYEDLINSYYIFYPGQFVHRYNSGSWSLLNTNDQNLMSYLGLSAGWIKNIHNLYSREDNDEQYNLMTALKELNYQFNELHKVCYMNMNNSYYKINNIEASVLYPGTENEVIEYIIITMAPAFSSNFYDYKDTVISTDSNIQSVYNSLDASININQIVVDFNYKVIYAIAKQVYPYDLINTNSLELLNNKLLNVKISSKAGNQLELITTQNDEEGLYVNVNT